MENKLYSTCGFKIDKKVLDDIEGRSYIVSGKSYNLRNLWIMAKDKQFGIDYPDEQKEALEVYNALAEELGQPKLGEKATPENKNVDGFAEFIRLLKANHEKTAQTKVKLDEELKQAKKDYEDALKENPNDTYTVNRLQIAWLNTQNKHHDEMEKLKNQSQLEIARLKTALSEKLNAFYKPNGKMIDTDTVALLNSGIKLTETEITNLINANANNPTMIRLIGGYCDNKGIKNVGVIRAVKLAMDNGKSEIDIFETLEQVTNAMFTEEGAYWSKPDRYKQIFENGIYSMCQSPLHREEYNAPTVKDSEDANKENMNRDNTQPSFTSAFN